MSMAEKVWVLAISQALLMGS